MSTQTDTHIKPNKMKETDEIFKFILQHNHNNGVFDTISESSHCSNYR